MNTDQRRLAAIVFTDIVGYSARMQRDETGTMNLVRADFARMRTVCLAHGGELLNSMGDGLLLCFPSAVDAVACALQIQSEFAQRKTEVPPDQALEHRVGVHLGDVFRQKPGGLAGDGVNIAARLQTRAPPGGICISQTVHDTVKGKVPMQAVFIGPEAFKNIAEPISIWHVTPTRDSTQTRPPQFGRKAKWRFPKWVLPAIACLLVAVAAVAYLTRTKRQTGFKAGPPLGHVGATGASKTPWENSLGMKFVPIPGIKVFFGVWDVRVQDYQAFASSTQREWIKPSFQQEPTHPVVNVRWEDAQAFCAWLTKKEQADGTLGVNQRYRLPTDAEWSVAVGLEEPARGTPKAKNAQAKTNWPWGIQWPPPRGSGNYAPGLNVDDFPETSPVGSFGVNQYGLCDMGGNVWQWCEDFFDGNTGSRVLRGGSFRSTVPNDLLSSARNSADNSHNNCGFRCVIAATP